MRRFFEAFAAHPRLALSGVALVALASALPILRIRFDDRPDAFIPEGHPALVAKERVEREFGLRDPMMLALWTGAPDGMFRPEPMALLKDLSDEALAALRALEASGEIPPAGDHPVYSLATENSVEAPVALAVLSTPPPPGSAHESSRFREEDSRPGKGAGAPLLATVNQPPQRPEPLGRGRRRELLGDGLGRDLQARRGAQVEVPQGQSAPH
ncbi:MAG: hypothetical protein ACRD2T_01455, partial [Thermoanaerobaculia bacterium]